MERKTIEFVPQPDFTDVAPKMLLKAQKKDTLYEKAFYSHKEVSDSEYCQNTTTWD